MFDNFYGLEGKPFQLTPDPAFYFRSITHRKALSYLGYGLAQGEGFIVITGEVGAGKSTLVAHLMGTIDPGQLTVAQIVTSKLDEEEIIHVVAQSFGLDIEGHDKASALGAIEGFLHAEARAGHRCLLIVDESQNLSVAALEELRMLSNFQLGSHPLLQTLLLGQPEFRATLQSHPALEQLRQRVIAAHHLEAMERGEIEPYIIHRLDKVGWNNNPRFEPGLFSDLFDASGGIPRRVNQIANRLLLLGAVEKRGTIDTAMLQVVIEEMAGERAFTERQVYDNTPAKTESTSAVPASEVRVPQLDQAMVEAMLAQRDAEIAKLRDTVAELSANRSDIALQPLLETRDARIAELREELTALSNHDPEIAMQSLLAKQDARIGELKEALAEISAHDPTAAIQPLLEVRDVQIAELKEALAELSTDAPAVDMQPLLAIRDAQITELQDAVAMLLSRDEGAAVQTLLKERDKQIAELQDSVAQLSARENDTAMLAQLAQRDAEIGELQEAVVSLSQREDSEAVNALLAQRDGQIAELQQAVVEISGQLAASQRAESMTADMLADMGRTQDRLARIEARMLEQENTLRQTLTMLIDWFDSDVEQSRAA